MIFMEITASERFYIDYRIAKKNEVSIYIRTILIMVTPGGGEVKDDRAGEEVDGMPKCRYARVIKRQGETK